MNKTKKILIAPLDWGLGHATRCIPIVSLLIELGADVIIAGNEKTNSLLQQEFPSLTYIYIEGYNVTYSSNKFLMPFSILRQIPLLIKTIKSENRYLTKLIATYNIDAVIADNRYGLYNNAIESVIITHQLQIQVPQSSIVQTLLNKVNVNLINKFNQCWVPDFTEMPIGGLLGVNANVKNQIYIGILSRFQLVKEPSTIKYALLVLISGPEPQRSIFESKAIEEAKKLGVNTLIVRGVPSNSNFRSLDKNIHIVDHLPAYLLQESILSAESIVCRAGYSTIMDLIKLKKTALLIPTPGQTEQEYLAKYLSELNLFTTQNQNNFNISSIKNIANNSKALLSLNIDVESYKKQIINWYKKL